jgi:hypothetical protein
MSHDMLDTSTKIRAAYKELHVGSATPDMRKPNKIVKLEGKEWIVTT